MQQKGEMSSVGWIGGVKNMLPELYSKCAGAKILHKPSWNRQCTSAGVLASRSGSEFPKPHEVLVLPAASYKLGNIVDKPSQCFEEASNKTRIIS